MTFLKALPNGTTLMHIQSGRTVPLNFKAVLRIRIRICRIRMFLGLLDMGPDPLVRGLDPAPDMDPFIT
jgi:hypothetical protein